MGTQLEVLPVGDYDVVVKTADATSSSGGKPMIKVKFSIESGPHAGRPLYNNFTISEENQNALLYFFSNMKSLGLESSFFASGPSLEQVAQNLVNKRARVSVAHRQWNNQTQPNITRINPPLGGQGAGPISGPGGPLTPGPAAPAPVAPAPSPVAPPAPAPAPAAPQAQQPTPPPAPEQVEAPASTPVVPENPPTPAPDPVTPAVAPEETQAPATGQSSPPPVPF